MNKILADTKSRKTLRVSNTYFMYRSPLQLTLLLLVTQIRGSILGQLARYPQSEFPQFSSVSYIKYKERTSIKSQSFSPTSFLATCRVLATYCKRNRNTCLSPARRTVRKTSAHKGERALQTETEN